MNPDYKEIGKNIRLMRIRHGISQSELAQRLDVSQTHMSNLEHGRVSVSLRVLLRLAHFFKCSVDTLLGSVLQGHVVPEVNNDGYDIEDLALLLKVLKQKKSRSDVNKIRKAAAVFNCGSLFYDNYLHCSHSLMTANNSSR